MIDVNFVRRTLLLFSAGSERRMNGRDGFALFAPKKEKKKISKPPELPYKPMKVIEAKLYPNKSQLAILNALLEKSRLLYNSVLQAKIIAYRKDKTVLSAFDLNKVFKGSEGIPSALLNTTTRRVEKAYKSFFRLNQGFPRFKSANRMRSIDLACYGPRGTYKIRDGKLVVWPRYGLGPIRIRGLQEFKGAKQGQLIRRASGWYLQMCVASTDKKQIKKVKSAIGIDLGLKSFVADSEGNKIPAPKFARLASNSFTVRQRGLSRSVRGSGRRKKKVNSIARYHEKIANQRKDFLHKLSRKYADQFDLIAVEKLAVRNMSKNRSFSRSIMDAGWSSFNWMLSYKLKTLGKYFVEVPSHYTSQKCSACGEIVKKSLAIRTHQCLCGYVADRDENAAKNIIKLGLGWAIGEGTAIAAPLTRRMLMHSPGQSVTTRNAS